MQFSTLKFGCECNLRGKFGKYLNAMRHSESSEDRSAISYALGVEGQGIGESLDCLVFLYPENR